LIRLALSGKMLTSCQAWSGRRILRAAGCRIRIPFRRRGPRPATGGRILADRVVPRAHQCRRPNRDCAQSSSERATRTANPRRRPRNTGGARDRGDYANFDLAARGGARRHRWGRALGSDRVSVVGSGHGGDSRFETHAEAQAQTAPKPVVGYRWSTNWTFRYPGLKKAGNLDDKRDPNRGQ